MQSGSIKSSQLLQQFQQIEPRARWVSRIWMRRLIRRHHHLTASARKAPHEDFFWIAANDLKQIVQLDALNLQHELLPETLLLLTEPGEELTEYPTAKILFHANIDHRIDEAFTQDDYSEWVTWLGPTFFHELQEVLIQLDRIIHPEKKQELVREWLAHWAELYWFERDNLKWFYPAAPEAETILAKLSPKVSLQTIFQQIQAVFPVEEGKTTQSKDFKSNLIQAEADLKQGAWASACIHAPTDPNILQGFLQQLRDCYTTITIHLGISDLQQVAVAANNNPLSPAGKGLRALQESIEEQTRKRFTVDPMGALCSFGRKKINRELPEVPAIQTILHLRKAIRYFNQTSIDHPECKPFEQAIHHLEDRYAVKHREQLRPILIQTLGEVGFRVSTIPEEIAREKLVEELIDQLFQRGFLRMSDVRDAIARSRIKLDDVPNPRRWLFGDALLQMNRKLDLRLDGVYRGGEIYLRWLHRLSSLFFGTQTGRYLTLYLLLPFLGSFLFLEAVQHLVEAVSSVGAAIVGSNTPITLAGMIGGGSYTFWMQHPDWQIPHYANILRTSLGAFCLFLLMHVPWVRKQLLRQAIWPAIDLFVWIWKSKLFKFYRAHLAIPFAAGLLTLISCRLLQLEWNATWLISIGSFLFFATFFHTPIGRRIEERFDETLDQFWRVISVNFFLGLFEIVLQFFQTIVGWIEWVLFRVDQSLRYEEGSSTLGYLIKFCINSIWFWISYCIRFAINLLIEPQINPIKHFPVVTVSHKLLLPMIPGLAKTFHTSNETMFTIVSGIPGIFGFLAWELKENWKLYRRNASTKIEALSVGSHGESLRGLLRPGFHSGEIPKIYRRIRQAITKKNEHTFHRLIHRLEHSEHTLHHHIDSEFVQGIHRAYLWKQEKLALKSIEFATNRIWIHFIIRDELVTIQIEERSGWLLASLIQTNGLLQLDADQLKVFQTALIYLYKLLGVDLIREQLGSKIRHPARHADVRDNYLIWQTRKDHHHQIDLRGDDPFFITSIEDPSHVSATIPGRDFLFSEFSFHWEDWLKLFHVDPTSPQDSFKDWQFVPEKVATAKGLR